ncbi:MAG: glutamate racemase [Anaerovoracaceae bacterium]
MLQEKFPQVPILGIIQPAAQKVINTCGEDNRIGIIGTKATIGSHAYSNIIKTFRPGLSVFEKATPTFALLIEEGFIQNDIMDLMIHYYLDDFVLENRIDTLVLGCTHYPLIRASIERLHPELKIVNPFRRSDREHRICTEGRKICWPKVRMRGTLFMPATCRRTL